MHLARTALHALLALLLLGATAQEVPQVPQDILSGTLTFVWNDPIGDVGCAKVLAGTEADDVPIEVRGPGTSVSNDTVELDMASEVLLNSETCGASGSPRTLFLRPGAPPRIPDGENVIAMDAFSGFLSGDELSDRIDFVFGGAVVGEDGAVAGALCPQPAANQEVSFMRAFLFRFNVDYRVATLDPQKPLQFRAGAMYAAMEVDAGIKADIGDTTRMVCIFAESSLRARTTDAGASDEDAGSSSTLSTGAIIGIAGGGVAALALLAAVLFFATAAHKRREAARSEDTPEWIPRRW